jgi:hypothetical protein
VLGYLEEASIPNSPDLSHTMSEVGILREMQTSIMDPEHEEVRSTNALRFWLQHFICENLLILETLNQRIEHSLKILQGVFPQLRGGGQDRSDYYLQQAGHTTLYRATSASRLAQVFKDEDLHLEKMCMRQPPPSDFSLDRTAYYWSPQNWVAEQFALYTQKNCKIPGDVAILRILCPSHHLQGVRTWKFDFGEEWQKLVWHSCGEELYPTKINDKWESASMIIGPVSINHIRDFFRMKSWSEVTERNISSKGGGTGWQCAEMPTSKR